ncbi:MULTISPECIES: cation diffusion facilitator family transporter [Pseudomonas]|uniref:cation diffusion facilitator family transporter n=1 Tax=Pseudomonas TaxID=286 RepID=UPI00058FF1F6|nr:MULTISPECIES: cation diffusion facilitator family transporter [Pseudomonas]MBA1245846.1 cation transporter [Pseudomonas japonica]
MGAGHSHSHGDVREGHQKKLVIALAMTTGIMLAEVIGAWVTGSLALLSDAAHMFTDAAALALSLVALQIAKRPADRRRTYGYARLEILASTFNAMLLFLVAMYILYEAWQRFFLPAEIATNVMLWIAVAGLLVNLASMRLLASASGESLNVKGAYLEVWADMLGSLGVIVAALVIRFTGWTWVDTLVAVGIGLWVLPRTVQLLRESLNILLEGVPDGVNLAEVEATILQIGGVEAVHDLHVWAVSSGHNLLTAHVVIKSEVADPDVVLAAVIEAVSHAHHIGHCTIQVERGDFHRQGPGLPEH